MDATGFISSLPEAEELMVLDAAPAPIEDTGVSESTVMPIEAPEAPVEPPPGNKDAGLLAIGDADTGLWLQIKDNCSLLDEYYKEYPNGRHIADYWQRRSVCLASR